MTEETGRRRSMTVLLGGVAVAVAVGALAARMSPNRTIGPSSPTNLALPVPQTAGDLDARTVQDRMLEELIVEAEASENPERLPAFGTFSLLVAEDPAEFDWVVARLSAADVSSELSTSFAGHLPGRRAALDSVVHRLLIQHLEGDDDEARKTALGVLRARGRTRVLPSPSCRCSFGVYPERPAAGQPAWLLAFSVVPDGRLRWSPREVRDGDTRTWELAAVADVDGETSLVQRFVAPDSAWELRVGLEADGPRLDFAGP